MVLELSCGGSLLEWLPANGPQLEVIELANILHQVALGLVHLKQHGIVHRDLAARYSLRMAVPNWLPGTWHDHGRPGAAFRPPFRIQSCKMSTVGPFVYSRTHGCIWP